MKGERREIPKLLGAVLEIPSKNDLREDIAHNEKNRVSNVNCILNIYFHLFTSSPHISFFEKSL